MLRSARSTRAYTLLEVIVAIVLTVMLGTAASMAMVVGTRSLSDARSRLADSAGANLFSTYFPADVQNVASPSGVTVGGNACGTSSAAVVSLATGEGTASYFVEALPEGRVLTRRLCRPDGTVTSNVLARTLASTSPTATCAGTASDACRTVTLSVTFASRPEPLSVSASRRLP